MFDLAMDSKPCRTAILQHVIISIGCHPPNNCTMGNFDRGGTLDLSMKPTIV